MQELGRKFSYDYILSVYFCLHNLTPIIGNLRLTKSQQSRRRISRNKVLIPLKNTRERGRSEVSEIYLCFSFF